MPRGYWVEKLVVVLASLLLMTALDAFGHSLDNQPPTAQSDVGTKPRIVESYGKLPLSFEANQGQTASEVKFLARGPRYGLFLTPTDAVLTLRKTNDAKTPLHRRDVGKGQDHPASADRSQGAPGSLPVILHIKLVGANPHPTIVGMDALPGKVNYLRGNDPKRWRTNIPTYRRVKYAQVYPGIDLVYYGNPQQLEHDFIVAPGAKPSGIAMDISGAGKASIDAKGDLVLKSHASGILLKKPVMYQEVNGRRRDIAGGYVLKDGQRVGFRVGVYDATKPLVIDPVLVYSTYLGGSGTDAAYGVAVDTAGNAYVTGWTESSDFPLAGNPVQSTLGGDSDLFDSDVFVAKLDAAGGALVYSTYLGGSSTDYGYGIAVNTAGNAYVTGFTYSSDFPSPPPRDKPVQSTLGGDSDVFVAKLDAAGSALVYSTYLGGSSADYGYGIAVDTAGNAHVTGWTESSDFPLAGNPVQSILGGSSDVFVAKLDAAGSTLVYSTYLGGSKYDGGYGIAVDTAGNAYVTGYTYSTDFPLAGSPVQSTLGGDPDFNDKDVFVAKLDAAGSTLVYSTYLGGSGLEHGYGIAVDTAGNAYVTGYTYSTDFPLAGSPVQSTLGGSSDIFVAELDAAGSTLVYSTYLGGSNYDVGYGIAVDTAGNAYVTGPTGSSDFPVAGSPVQSTIGHFSDTFVAKLDAAGSPLVYSTYLGGSNRDVGYGIAVDTAGNAYVTGPTASSDFPVAGEPAQVSLAGGSDAFVTKIGGPN
jgi:hypothetical protein